MAMIKCAGCGKFVSPKQSGACPSCGSIDRHITASEKGAGIESEAITTLREYWEHNKILWTVVLIITIGSPFLGLAFFGCLGVIIGIVLGISSLVVGFRATTKVREIKSWSGKTGQGR